jgi:hypothetical protein
MLRYTRLDQFRMGSVIFYSDLVQLVLVCEGAED